MLQSLSKPNRSEPDPYLVQKIMTASPEQLISYIYDAILNGCRTENQEKVLVGLMELVKALNFDYEEIAVPMYQLYEYCQENARKKNYSVVEEVICDLKATWVEVMNVK